MEEGVGNAPTSARADPVFETGAASLYLPAFQKWSGWQELHLRPPRSERGRLLLTLYPANGCQTWTRTKTSGLTGRRATLTPPGNGAAGRIPTCIIPFRKRMPHVFLHGSNSNGRNGRIGLPKSCRVFPQTGRSLREKQTTCGLPVPSR